MKITNRKKAFPWTLIYIFFGIVIGFVFLGFWYYNSIEMQFKSDAHKQVTSIGDLKVQQINSWFLERKADARALSTNRISLESFNRFLETGKDKKKLLQLFQLYCQNYEYITISLIDKMGKIRLVYGENKDFLSKVDNALIKQVIEEPKLQFSELHISEFKDNVVLDLFIPLMEEKTGNHEISGILLMRVDPNLMLYPLLQNWPTESETGETLLLKLEDEEVVFLNELRYKKNTALKFRLPLNTLDAIFCEAIKGKERIFEGADYRGVQVLGSVKKIPGTSWIMVSKIDSNEIEQPLREQATVVWIVVILLVGISGVLIGLYWRHQRSRYYEDLLKLEIENKALSKHVDHIVKYANDIIILFDDDLNVIEVNDQACNTYGYSREEFLQKNAADLRPAPLRDKLKNIFSKYEDGKGHIYETVHIKKDGTEFYIEVSGRLFSIDIGKYYQTIIRDISERKKFLEELRGLSLRNEAILASVPDIIMEVDNNKIYTWANKAGYEYFGNDVVGKSADYYFEGSQKVYEMVQLLFEGNENIIYIESWQRRCDGEVRLLAWWCRVLKNETGSVTGALSTARDITDQKAIEEKFRSLYETMTEGVALHQVVYDKEGKPIDYRIEDINPAFEKHVGIAVDVAKGALASELYGVSPAPFIDEYSKVAESGKPYSFQIYFPPLSKHFEISVFSPQKGWFATIFNDITERKISESKIIQLNEELEERVIKRTEQLEASNKELEAFSYSVSHDLRSPLRALDGFARILKDEYSNNLDEEGARLLNVIIDNSQIMGNLIDDLLAFSRIGRQDMQFNPIDMHQLANSVFIELTQFNQAKKIKFNLQKITGAKGDSSMIRQVWVNLISNALKFSSTKDEQIIEVGCVEEENENIYFVKDNGVGFSMEYSNKLFGVFQRLHSMKDFEGTGVGLALVQRIVSRHGGRVWGEGKLNEGATFYFSLKKQGN